MANRHRNILATREGLVGHKTYCGWPIETDFPFVALPSVKAIRRLVMVFTATQQVLAVVMDVGPWNMHDDGYVFDTDRPKAEAGIREPGLGGPPTNKAGIDLGERVHYLLGLTTDNAFVDWEFY